MTNMASDSTPTVSQEEMLKKLANMKREQRDYYETIQKEPTEEEKVKIEIEGMKKIIKDTFFALPNVPKKLQEMALSDLYESISKLHPRSQKTVKEIFEYYMKLYENQYLFMPREIAKLQTSDDVKPSMPTVQATVPSAPSTVTIQKKRRSTGDTVPRKSKVSKLSSENPLQKAEKEPIIRRRGPKKFTKHSEIPMPLDTKMAKSYQYTGIVGAPEKAIMPFGIQVTSSEFQKDSENMATPSKNPGIKRTYSKKSMGLPDPMVPSSEVLTSSKDSRPKRKYTKRSIIFCGTTVTTSELPTPSAPFVTSSGANITSSNSLPNVENPLEKLKILSESMLTSSNKSTSSEAFTSPQNSGSDLTSSELMVTSSKSHTSSQYVRTSSENPTVPYGAVITSSYISTSSQNPHSIYTSSDAPKLSMASLPNSGSVLTSPMNSPPVLTPIKNSEYTVTSSDISPTSSESSTTSSECPKLVFIKQEVIEEPEIPMEEIELAGFLKHCTDVFKNIRRFNYDVQIVTMYHMVQAVLKLSPSNQYQCSQHLTKCLLEYIRQGAYGPFMNQFYYE